MKTTFEYGVSRLGQFQVQTSQNAHGTSHATWIELNGERVAPSKRFWNSLQIRFGFTANIFRYFSHEEVFQRISEKSRNDELRWCLERNSNESHARLLAVTNPVSPTITHDDLMEVFDKFGTEEMSYHDGVVRSNHGPKYAAPYDIAGDQFESKFVIDTPIDGFGRPSLYLSLLRQICTNGAVAYCPTFRSELNVGKGVQGTTFVLQRAMEGFNNEEGFAALRERFESATQSWASVNEVQRLYKLLIKLLNAHDLPMRGVRKVKKYGTDGASELNDLPVMHGFQKLTGDLTMMYGLANLDTLTVKRQQTLPSACRVYDLLNFASELATHHATENGSRGLHAYIGDLVSSEYDLEGTANHYDDWRDFFITNDAAIDTISKIR